MHVSDAIRNRREITQFTSESIPEEQINEIARALYLSPSGNNLPSREFILITNETLLQTLSVATPYMKWLEGAAAGIVVIGNPIVSKYWLQDASIAGGYAWLTAASLGIGAAWGAVYHAEDEAESKRREDYVRGVLQIPADYRVVTILGFGYAAKEPAKKDMYPMDRIFHRERFG